MDQATRIAMRLSKYEPDLKSVFKLSGIERFPWVGQTGATKMPLKSLWNQRFAQGAMPI